MGGLECVITGLMDRSPPSLIWKKKKIQPIEINLEWTYKISRKEYGAARSSLKKLIKLVSNELVSLNLTFEMIWGPKNWNWKVRVIYYYYYYEFLGKNVEKYRFHNLSLDYKTLSILRVKFNAHLIITFPQQYVSFLFFSLFIFI